MTDKPVNVVLSGAPLLTAKRIASTSLAIQQQCESLQKQMATLHDQGNAEIKGMVKALMLEVKAPEGSQVDNLNLGYLESNNLAILTYWPPGADDAPDHPSVGDQALN